MTTWFKTTDKKPEFADGAGTVYVQAWNAGPYSRGVFPLAYRRHLSAKTERGRLPRFEYAGGGIASEPEYWAYMSEFQQPAQVTDAA